MLDHPAECVKLSPMSLRLVPLSGRHLRDLQSLAAGEAIAPWLAPPSPDLDGRAFVERAQRLRARGGRETFAICEDDRLLGIGVLTRREEAPEHAELGYWIGRPYRGRGHATAAGARLLARGFERMRLILVIARSPSANRASVRVLEKLGLRFVGVEPSVDPPGSGEAVRRYEMTRAAWHRLRRSR